MSVWYQYLLMTHISVYKKRELNSSLFTPHPSLLTLILYLPHSLHITHITPHSSLLTPHSPHSSLPPRYLNDLCYLEIREGTSLQWQNPIIEGSTPSPRESHAAVTIGPRLLIYGGMNGRRLGDVWILEVGE